MYRLEMKEASIFDVLVLKCADTIMHIITIVPKHTLLPAQLL